MPLTTLKASNFVNDSVTIGKLSTSGTASSSTYLRGDNSWQALSGLSGLYNANPTTNIVVTVAASKFVIDGVSQGTISLTEGYTYTFDVSDNTNTGHPLRFSTTSNGTHNSGVEYAEGIFVSGTAGSAGAKVVFSVPLGAQQLYYYCGNHSGMGGTANTTTAPAVVEGDIWVTNGKFYITNDSTLANAAGVFSSISNIPTAKYFGGAAGTQTAALHFGGLANSPTTDWSNQTDEYNGSTWSHGGNLPTGVQYNNGSGTFSAALSVGGIKQSPNVRIYESKEYNGTAWAAGGNMVSNIGGEMVGTLSASYLGNTYNHSSSTYSTTTYGYDGVSWSTDSRTTLTARGGSFVGMYNSALKFANGSNIGTESVDQTSWSTSVSLLEKRGNAPAVMGNGANSVTYAGGYDNPISALQSSSRQFDGTSWSAGGSLSTVAYAHNNGGAGSSMSRGLAISGRNDSLSPRETFRCEEFTGTEYVIEFVQV